MVGVKKIRLIFVVTVVVSIIYLLRLLLMVHLSMQQSIDDSNGIPGIQNLMEEDDELELPSIIIVIREFELFDNDVSETVESVLRVCTSCTLIVVSDELIYPPLVLPKLVKHYILSPDINRKPADVTSIIKKFEYILLLPDGARLSSTEQLIDLTRLLEAGDSVGVIAGVGGKTITCQQLMLDVPRWELHIAPNPDSEACDAVSGRGAIFMRSSYYTSLAVPWARPVTLSLGIQGTLKGWKHHIAKGMLLGEGRELLESQHFKWKFETVNEERVIALYKTLGIKKVIGSSQKVEWYGCTRQTPRCFPTVVQDTPSYLFNGRWTPPCCLEALRATARHVFIALKTCRARWWLEGGSLLGAVRIGDIIPWDYDVDIGIYSTDIDRCPQLKASRWQTLEDADGFVWQRAKGYYQVHYSTANHLHVDIFAFTPRAGTMVRSENWNTAHRQDIDFPEHFLRPFSTVEFAGVQAAAPNNVRDFLEYKFGPAVIENPQYPNPEVLLGLNVSLPPPK